MNLHARSLLPLLALASLAAEGCAGVSTAAISPRGDAPAAVVRVGLLHARLGERPTLGFQATNTGAERYVITSALGTFRVTGRGTNDALVVIESPHRAWAPGLALLLGPDAEAVFAPRPPGKSSLTLFGLHLVSPALSAVYAGAQNPFADRGNVGWRALLAVAVDGAGTWACATKGFGQRFRFNAAAAAFLLVHRAVMLPDLLVETDLHDRAVRGGYRWRF